MNLEMLDTQFGLNWAPHNEIGVKTRKWVSPGSNAKTGERAKLYLVKVERRDGSYGWTSLYAFSGEEAVSAARVFISPIKKFERPKEHPRDNDIIGWAVFEVQYPSEKARHEEFVAGFGRWDETSSEVCFGEQQRRRWVMSYGIQMDGVFTG